MAGILGVSWVTASGGSVTIPTGTLAVIMCWCYYNGATGQGLTSATLGGISFTERTETLTAAADRNAIGIATVVNSGTGSQTFNFTLDAGATEGPSIVLVFLDDVNTADFYRDAASAAQQGTAAISATCTSATTDTVVGFDVRYTGSTAGSPALEAGWTDRGTASNNNEGARVRTLNSPGAATSTINAQTLLDYSAVALISIKANSGGGAATSLLRRSPGARLAPYLHF